MSVLEKRRASARLKDSPAKVPNVSTRQSLQETLIDKPKPKSKAEPNPAFVHSPSPEPDIESLLPAKLQDGAPLPVLPRDYISTKPDDYYQNIVDSGVLAASLLRSRQRWAQGSFFEKYWSKSTYKKKKDVTDVDKNQVKDPRPPMTKVGTCKLIAEPHIFDVTLFVVREPNAAPQQAQPKPAQHKQPSPATRPFIDRPFVQYGPTQHMHSSNQPPSLSQQNSPHIRPYSPYQTPLSTSSAMPPATSTPKPFSVTTATTTTPSTLSPINAPLPPPLIHILPSPLPPPPPPPPSPSPPKPNAATDPVIQALAQRASTDDALKQVMKIVASGTATQQQLEYFQKHIDELTLQVKQKQEAERKLAAAAATTAPGKTGGMVNVHGKPVNPRYPVTPKPELQIQQHQPNPVTSSRSNYGAPIAAAPSRPPIFPSPFSNGPTQQQPQQYPHRPPQAPRLHHPVKPRAIVAATSALAGPAPLHVLIEFSINSTDRFLFPKYAILQIIPDGTNLNGAMLVSFLVVKPKPEPVSSEAAAAAGSTPLADEKDVKASKKTKAKKAGSDPVGGQELTLEEREAEELKEKVYQPVTLRLERPSDQTVFGVLARVVAPAEEVRKHMIEIAEKWERADEVRLALRLPKEAKV